MCLAVCLFPLVASLSCIFIKLLQHALFMFYNNCHGPAANIWKIEENLAFHFSVPNENPSGAASSFAATRNFYNNFSICVWPSWQINSSAQWSVYCAGKTFIFWWPCWAEGVVTKNQDIRREILVSTYFFFNNRADRDGNIQSIKNQLIAMIININIV